MNTSTIYTLNDLIQKNLDAEHGYLNAAANVNDPILRNFFHAARENRQRFAKELSARVIELGGQPTQTTSFVADAHRTWMDLRAAFSSHNEDVVLRECIRGEEATVHDYKEALEGDSLDEKSRTMVARQFEQVLARFDEIRRMERITA